MRGLFDTNIIIDFLKGEQKAKSELEQYTDKYISIITYIEVLVGVVDAKEKEIIRDFLHSFNIIDVNKEVSDLAIKAKQKYKLKIPDALIMASAEISGAMLISRNTKDFPPVIPIVRVPYEL